MRAGFRALLVAPLLRGDEIVGTLVVRRRTAGEFAQSTIDLIKTFAAQSAVAIESRAAYLEQPSPEQYPDPAHLLCVYREACLARPIDRGASRTRLKTRSISSTTSRAFLSS